MRVTISAKSALLFAALLSGNTNGLQSIQDSAISTMGRDGRLPLMTTEATLALCTIAVVEDDAETAGIYFSQLAEVALSNPMQYVLFMERVLGMTAALLGNEDDATHHFERALEFCRSAGYRPELAWSCAAYADLLLGRNQPDDPSTSSGQRREKATELQDEAIAIATDLGMKSLLERVLASREILKA